MSAANLANKINAELGEFIHTLCKLAEQNGVDLVVIAHYIHPDGRCSCDLYNTQTPDREIMHILASTLKNLIDAGA